MNSTLVTNNSNKIRVVVTDDTALYRRTIADILKSIPDVEVIGAAFDGQDCLEIAQKLQPDLITLDIQMPRLDGLATLEQLRKRKINSEVVMVCSETRESADQTLKALRMGALDLILKPNGGNIAENKCNLESQLLQHVKTVQFRRRKKTPLPHKVFANNSTPNTVKPSTSEFSKPRCGKPRCVCIGVSTGGPQALNTLVSGLPGNLPVPIFVVQHMPPVFTKSLADHLNRSGEIRVSEAVDGEIAIAGRIYIAPGGKQMSINQSGVALRVNITDDPPVSACKPSVDYLFESIDACIGKDVIAVIMTGMGNDGHAGCKKLHASGARIIAQSGETCVVYGMPKQIVDSNLAHEIVPLDQLSGRITQLLTSTRCS